MTKDKVAKIHDASMRILEQAGVRFLHTDAQNVLKEHGMRVEGDRAFFTEEQIKEWVGKAPSAVEVVGGDPHFKVTLGKGQTYNAPAAGAVAILERDGSRRKVTFEDYAKALKLHEGNPSYMINGGVPCQPVEIPPEHATLLLHYASLLLSNKVLWPSTGSYDQMEGVMSLTRARYGQTPEEMRDTPHMLAIINTNSPLQLGKSMTETLFTLLKHRVPVAISAAGMAGTTTPMTLAGTLAVTNAEIVASMALAQMFAPGAPVLYGSQTATADMRNGAMAIGSPEGALCYKYCAELARHYGVPSRAGGALTDAKKTDAQAGYESMLTYYACKESGVDVVFQSAGILNGYLDLSFDKLVVDFEIIDIADRYTRGFEVDENSIPLEDIVEVGPGGQYLLTDHTLMNCRTEPLLPAISVRGSCEDPLTQLERNIDARIERLLASYVRPEIDDETREEMRCVLRSKGVPSQMIDKVDSLAC